jgi:hypothetical protein
MKKIFLIASLTLATAGFAQKVNNRLTFQKGQKLEVLVETNKNSSIEIMGQTMETKVTSAITEVLDVEDAGKEGATIEHKIKQVKFNLTNPMQSQSFDSEKDADRNGEIGKMLEKSIKNKYTMTVDPTGKITSVKVDDDNPNDKSKDMADMADLLSAQLGLNMGVPTVGDASSFKILPDNQVGVGDTWTDSSSSEGQTKKTTYTVKSITDGEVLLDFTELLNVNTTQQIMGTEATIKTNDKTAGTIILDRATGLLKQKKAIMEEEGTMEAQGQSIPMKGKTEITVTVKPS